MRRISLVIAMLSFMAISNISFAQTKRSQVVENGGTGKFKAEIVEDASLPTHMVYRPTDLKAAVNDAGKLPVILYANGGCANSSIEIRYFLNELASHGYVAVAIGPYEEDDFFAHWTDVMQNMYPENKTVVLANGTVVEKPTAEQVKARQEMIQKMIAQESQQQNSKKSKKNQPTPPPVNVSSQPTSPLMLLDALDWLIKQNADKESEYYHMLDLSKVAVMGQSCGGVQAIGVAHDPRVSTCVVLNSGMGDMQMQGITPAQLDNINVPMFYLIGGPTDIAYANAAKDFEKLQNISVVMANTQDGHEGTYYEAHGGLYAEAVLSWLDWQLKGCLSECAPFVNERAAALMYPDWTFVRKNF